MTFASTTRDFACMSDNGQVLVLREIQFSPALPFSLTLEPQQLSAIPMASPSRPLFVTTQNFTEQTLTTGDHAALVAGLDQRFRMLRLVVERLPKHFTPYKHEPSYKLTYYVERLSCGHERIYYPQSGPMSRRRHCAECAALALPPKKPVSNSQDERERAA